MEAKDMNGVEIKEGDAVRKYGFAGAFKNGRVERLVPGRSGYPPECLVRWGGRQVKVNERASCLAVLSPDPDPEPDELAALRAKLAEVEAERDRYREALEQIGSECGEMCLRRQETRPHCRCDAGIVRKALEGSDE